MQRSFYCRSILLPVLLIIATATLSAQQSAAAQSSASMLGNGDLQPSTDSVLALLNSGSLQMLLLAFILFVVVLWLMFGRRVSLNASAELSNITDARFRLRSGLGRFKGMPHLTFSNPLQRLSDQLYPSLAPIKDEGVEDHVREDESRSSAESKGLPPDQT